MSKPLPTEINLLLFLNIEAAKEYFDIAKWSYLQFTMILPYIMMGPTIVSGVITLGILQQILRAFGKVEESFQFLVNSWGTIVELICIYKRLKVPGHKVLSSL